MRLYYPPYKEKARRAIAYAATDSITGVFIGAMADHSGDEHTSPNMIAEFESAVKKPHSFYNITNNFFDPSSKAAGLKFPSAEANYCKTNGKVPLIQLNPCIKTNSQSSLPPLSDMGPYTLANISSGKVDTELTAWLNAAKSFASPLLVIMGDEANGQWFAWSNEGPEPFKAAFRHIVTLGRQVGATNIKWIYDVDITFDSGRMHSYYPGGDVVDILGGSSYGESDSPKGCFSALNHYYADWASVDATKPLGCFEWGLGDPNDYTQTFAGLKANKWPRIKYSLVWSESKGSSMGPGGQGNAVDWNPASLAAYQAAIAPDTFIGSGAALNTYLSGGSGGDSSIVTGDTGGTVATGGGIGGTIGGLFSNNKKTLYIVIGVVLLLLLLFLI